MISFGGWKEAWTYDQFAMCVCVPQCVSRKLPVFIQKMMVNVSLRFNKNLGCWIWEFPFNSTWSPNQVHIVKDIIGENYGDIGGTYPQAVRRLMEHIIN